MLLLQINVDATYQTIDNFGASDAWQCAVVGKNWPVEKRERIAELLFSRDTDAAGNPCGIGLSLWRFYITAGTEEQGENSDIGNAWRRGECFQNPDGTYDWTKQSGQQWFLKAARRHGVEQFLAFPNAAPVHLSRNGKGYADKGDGRFNLHPGKYDDYATFLTDVVAHFAQEGLPFDYLSPFNEPQWDWDGRGQEGTPALNIEQHALVRYLSQEMERRGLPTRIVVTEAGTIGHLMQKIADDGRDDQIRFFFDPHSPFYIGALPNVAPLICGHSYFTVWPLSDQIKHRRTLHEVITDTNPALGYWQTEYCILEKNDEIGEGGGRDLGMDTALYVARIIHHDLTLAQARSWQWWTAVSQVDFKDGLVYLDDGSAGDTGAMGPETTSLWQDGVVRDSKLLWAFGNYSRFIRPGMVRIACNFDVEQSPADGVLSSAYRSADGSVVVVLTNLSTQEQQCHLGSDRTIDVYTTAATANLAKSRQQASQVTLPARSVVTCLL